jgi:hypothetical protein
MYRDRKAEALDAAFLKAEQDESERDQTGAVRILIADGKLGPDATERERRFVAIREAVARRKGKP